MGLLEALKNFRSNQNSKLSLNIWSSFIDHHLWMSLGNVKFWEVVLSYIDAMMVMVGLWILTLLCACMISVLHPQNKDDSVYYFRLLWGLMEIMLVEVLAQNPHAVGTHWFIFYCWDVPHKNSEKLLNLSILFIIQIQSHKNRSLF